ncbi:MAG: DivIVA domain-containing protein [Ruminococcaceae bacterium]|nr:DivIVA domain-containing protein [Oscillospiraceae bacterium]
MKTPEQIRDMEFQSSPVGGYKKSDVDLFLEEMAAQVEVLMKQKLEADRKLQEIDKKAPEAALSSAGIQNVLVSAQRVAEQLTDDARKTAEAIIADANLKLTEAGIKAQEIISEAEKNASLLGKTAEAEATKIVAEAVKKAEELSAASKTSAEEQKKLYENLKAEVAAFKKDVVLKVESVKELLSDLPDAAPIAVADTDDFSVKFADPAELLKSAVKEKEFEFAEEPIELTDEPLKEEFKVDMLKVTVEPEVKTETAPILETVYEDVVSTSAMPAMPVIADAVDIPVADTERDEYQLSFDEATLSIPSVVEPEIKLEKAVDKKPKFVIEDEAEEMPIKKGRISFGDDDDDDDDEDDEGFFFKKKKK